MESKFLLFAASVMLLISVSYAQGLTCPNGWTSHGESCYNFLHETYNWFDARAVCNILGGYLAEDESAEEHGFLTGLVRSRGGSDARAWIGLQDFAEENQFVWTHSGYPADPLMWNQGEPQDAHGEEDCVAIFHSGWQDANCEDNRYSIICERPATEEAIIG